ncbi:hypothetical protein B6N26_00011 [Salmonella enterica subsp. enterica]|nr:hypothetical protein B6N26_00011 [Salmonella enterica subsp. enterica]
MAPLIGVIVRYRQWRPLSYWRITVSLPAKNRHVRCDDLSVPRNEVNAQPGCEVCGQ